MTQIVSPFVICFAVLASGADDGTTPHADDAASDAVVTVTEHTFNDYHIRITKYPDPQLDPMSSSLEIFKEDKLVFKKNEWRFYFGHPVDENGANGLVRIGSDITGNGEPNLVISSWTGGAHCCFSFLIFELGETFRHLAAIETKDSDLAHFEDRDGDANLEFVLWDFAFAYWNASFADSPAPQIVLRYSDDGYHIAEDQMRASAPGESEIRERAAETAAHPRWTEGRPPTKLWDTMLKWIYSGNDDAAWALLDQAWPPEVPGKEEFRGAFKEQLAKSQWWPEIKTMCDRPKVEKRP